MRQIGGFMGPTLLVLRVVGTARYLADGMMRDAA
jgi:hypothetical protein